MMFKNVLSQIELISGAKFIDELRKYSIRVPWFDQQLEHGSQTHGRGPHVARLMHWCGPRTPQKMTRV